MNARKTICFFGIYDPEYARTKVLREGFEANGYEVLPARIDPKRAAGWGKYISLFQEGWRIRKAKPDLILVCFPGHTVVWMARMLFGNRIMFDAFVSLYDSNVFDRGSYQPGSWKAYRDLRMDRISCSLASVVLLDTDAHREYFAETIGVPLVKTERVFIGADLAIFSPEGEIAAKTDSRTLVTFHGTFIPLQGIEYIIDAVALLPQEDFCFRIIGSGQTYDEMRAYAKEKEVDEVIEWTGRLPITEAAKHVRAADITLGIFGTTPKTRRVIPNKAFECAAAGKALITADTPAIREFFTPGENIEVCAIGSSESLATSIRKVKGDEGYRRRLGESARELVQAELQPKGIVARLLEALQDRHPRVLGQASVR